MAQTGPTFGNGNVRIARVANPELKPKHNMDAILFSANPSMVMVDDAVRHLSEHEELYWEVGFRISKIVFSFPIMGFMHICGGQVEYRATIRDIIPFSPSHYMDKKLATRIKPEPWLHEWNENLNDMQSYPWKNALVMTEIMPFSYDTYSFLKSDGTLIKNPPQSYARVLIPGQSTEDISTRLVQNHIAAHASILERNLEDFTILQLDAIEPGLHLVRRQFSTPAGRIDLLCKDAEGSYVVVELKRNQGTDQVMGQILRYMGWLKEEYPSKKVRGIVIVAKKDQALLYASKAVPNVLVKEFKLSIS